MRRALAAGLVAATSLAWLDAHQPVRDANRLYDAGKYEDAAAAYNAALVDKPDSDPLHFNLGDATYKQGKYDEAVSAFQKVETTNDPTRGSRVAYNVGNAKFRQGQALEQTEPQKALGLYAEGLASYRRALALTPDDEDSKFNHELVAKRIEDVKKRLEEQKKDQDQQKQDQPDKQDQEKQDQPQQPDTPKEDQQQQDDQQKQDQEQQQQEDQQQQDRQQQDQNKQDENQQDHQQAGDEPKDDAKKDEQQQQQGQEASEPSAEQKDQQQGEPPEDVFADEKKKDGELSKGEAAAILDSQKGEEVSPEDVIKKMQGARVAEPAEDW